MNIFRLLDKIFPPGTALAHCDIPCGIYESDSAILAAHTIERMVEILEALPSENLSGKDLNNYIRCVDIKEKHASLCKHELFTLWADFFEEKHLEKFPDLHEKFWKAIKLCSKNKREVSMTEAKALSAAVSEIADMFAEVAVEPKMDLSGEISDSFDSPKTKVLGENKNS